MKRKTLMLSLTILISVPGLFWGCSSSAKTSGDRIPDWVDNPENSFSDHTYLMAVGSGSTLNEARSDAFASLSQIFQMDINALEEVNTEFLEQTTNNQFYSEKTSQILNNIKIGTKQELMNSIILASEVDGNGTYYALAGMDRAESTRIYREEISNNTIKINEFESIAGKENNVLQKLVLLKKAKAVASANEILNRQLNIILGGSASGGESTKTLVEIEEKFRSLQKNATVSIQSENAPETINSAIAGVFQKAGFSVSDNSKSALLFVDVNFLTQAADLNRNDSEFVKWELVIEVVDQQTKRSFKTFMAEGRDGAPSYSDALKRADYTARTKINRDFNTFLNNELLATY